MTEPNIPPDTDDDVQMDQGIPPAPYVPPVEDQMTAMSQRWREEDADRANSRMWGFR